MRTLVIGYGNDLRTDDGVGPWIARQLEEKPGPWQVLVARQLLPEHAEMMQQYDRVILVDAACDLPPGQTRCSRVEPADDSQLHPHRLDPPGLLALMRRVYDLMPEMWLVAIGGQDWGLGETLTPIVQQAATQWLADFPDWLDHKLGAAHHA